MLTKLGKSCLGMIRKNTGVTSFISFQVDSSIAVKCSKKAKDYSGTEKYLSMLVYSAAFTPRVGSITNPGIYFGSGSTPATEDDYTIENLISSGISVTYSPTDNNGTYYYDEESNSECAYITYTITNTGSSSVSISEICNFSQFQVGTDYGVAPAAGSANRSLFLIDRTLLDAPLVIGVGESAVLRYEIVFHGDDIA